MSGVQNMMVFKAGNECRIGVISDTHGLLRPQVKTVFEGVDLILHAGDVGGRDVITQLKEIAPVTAVMGNMDGGDTGALNPVEVVVVGAVSLYMLHERHNLDIDPTGGRFQAVIYGHTHRPEIQWQKEVLYLNPGSAGPRRFDYPVSVARLDIQGTRLSPRIIELEV